MKPLRLLVSYLLLLSPAVATASTYEFGSEAATTTRTVIPWFTLELIALGLLSGLLVTVLLRVERGSRTSSL